VPFGFAGDPDPLVSGLLAEAVDAGHAGRRATLFGGAGGELNVGRVPMTRISSPSLGHFGGSGKPARGQLTANQTPTSSAMNYKITWAAGPLGTLADLGIDQPAGNVGPWVYVVGRADPVIAVRDEQLPFLPEAPRTSSAGANLFPCLTS